MNFNCTGLENLEKQKIQWLSYFMVNIELRVSMKVCLTCNSKQFYLWQPLILEFNHLK